MPSHPRCTIHPPLHLLESIEKCWKCKRPQQVVALAAFNVTEEGEDGNESEPDESDISEDSKPFLLSCITSMPSGVLDLIISVNPRYRLHQSRTAKSTYYANTCECGANFGDFYLFSEPGHAFFPTLEEEAAIITISKLPITDSFQMECEWSLGPGHYIFKHGKHR